MRKSRKDIQADLDEINNTLLKGSRHKVSIYRDNRHLDHWGKTYDIKGYRMVLEPRNRKDKYIFGITDLTNANNLSLAEAAARLDRNIRKDHGEELVRTAKSVDKNLSECKQVYHENVLSKTRQAKARKAKQNDK